MYKLYSRIYDHETIFECPERKFYFSASSFYDWYKARNKLTPYFFEWLNECVDKTKSSFLKSWVLNAYINFRGWNK